MSRYDSAVFRHRPGWSVAILCFPPIAHVAASHGSHAGTTAGLALWPLMAVLAALVVVAWALVRVSVEAPGRFVYQPSLCPGGIKT